MRDSGMTLRAIGQQLGLSRQRVSRIVQRTNHAWPICRRLRIAKVRLDFQPAENLIDETVQKYIELLRRGDQLSPVRVRFDGANYFLEDGFHRLEAARLMGRKTVKAEIFPGTLSEMEAEFGDYLKCLRAEIKTGKRKRGTR